MTNVHRWWPSGSFDGVGVDGHHSPCHPSWHPPGRAQPAPPDAPGQETVNPLRLPTPSRPMSGAVNRPSRRVERQERPRARRSQKEPVRTHDDSHHHRLGGRSLRGHAPHAPPGLDRHPSLLQHERLHQLPDRRSRHRDRKLPDLRLHPPHALTVAARPGRGPGLRPTWSGHACAPSALYDERTGPTARRALLQPPNCAPGAQIVVGRPLPGPAARPQPS